MSRKKIVQSKELSDAGKQLDCLPTHGLYGLLLAFVVVSNVYSVYVIAMGTASWLPKVMVAPEALFAAVVFVRKFIRK